MKNILAVIIFILGIVLAGYIGGWLMFVKPIINCCKAFDLGTLSGLMVGMTALKCVFASAVAGVIMWITSILCITIKYK